MRLVICLIIVIASLSLSAQEVSDNTPLQYLYDSLFQTSKSLINGRLNNEKYPKSTGHPFYGEYGWAKGAINIEGTDIPYHALRYDLVNDNLLIQHFSVTGSRAIIVNKDITREFTLENHRFVLFDAQPGPVNKPEPGYYESVFRSETELWIKWIKYYSESSGSFECKLRRTKFIMNKGIFYKISNRKSLLHAFPDREDDIKAYLRKHHIVVKQATDDQFVGLLQFYENNSISDIE